MQYTSHYSVLKKEVLEAIADINPSLGADLTFGGGGHTFALLGEHPQLKMVSFDQDQQAIDNGLANIEKFGFKDRLTLVKSNFENFPKWARENQESKFDFILMDVGVSSHHFESGERGFSFLKDFPLDMRMDATNTTIATAAEILAKSTMSELEHIFREYGEEKFAKKIAARIVDVRERDPITTTFALRDLVIDCYPMKLRFGKTNPATKVFQALRIAVNRELEVLENTVNEAISMLEENGLLMVISFHSLEDRIVKKCFKEAMSGEVPFETLSKKPIVPSEREIKENSKSRSAKLRILKKVTSKRQKNKYAQFSKVQIKE